MDQRTSTGAVFAAGLVTSIATIALVWFLGSSAEFNVMGFYLWFIFPIGAIIAGLLAGSGYGLAARLLGVRVVLWALIAIGVLQFLIYMGAKYAEYSFVFSQLKENPEFMLAAATNPEAKAFLEMGFFSYFDLNTQSFAFDEGSDGMGLWGYAFRLLEIGGFVGGGIGTLLMSKGAAYCESCEQYMKTKPVATIPASLHPNKVKKKDIEGQEVEAARQEQAWNDGHTLAATLLEAIDNQSPEAITHSLQEIAAYNMENKKAGQVNIKFDKTACTGCGDGFVVADRVLVVGEDTTIEPIAQLASNAQLDASLSK